MLRAHALHKRFGEVLAVDGVEFEAHDGQITALLGPNGAGKTTTLRMLYGLLAPDAGTCHIEDIDVANDPEGARRQLGVLPDARGLYPRLTAREHLQYFARLQGLPRSVEAERIDDLASALGMESILDRRVQGFSQGERTKVALARALVHLPQNIVLDEPSHGLDVMTTRALRTFIRKLRSDGHCVVFSSHVMQEVAALSDRVVIIAQGRVVADAPPDQLATIANTDSLEDAFVALSEGEVPQ